MKIYSFILILLCVIVSCKSKVKKDNDIKIGKYLYLSDNNVLHCKQDCIGLILANGEDEINLTGMTFVDTLDIVYDGNLSYCTSCFNDSLYEKVQGMIKRNRANNTMSGVSLDSIDYDYKRKKN